MTDEYVIKSTATGQYVKDLSTENKDGQLDVKWNWCPHLKDAKRFAYMTDANQFAYDADISNYRVANVADEQ